MRIELIEGLQKLIICFLVYVPIATISGWFTALIAKKCDDETPQNLGFLTLDPFAHFSFFGFTFLLLGKFFGNYITFLRGVPGFGRFIILDPSADQPWYKAAAEFFARAFSYFVMFIVSFLVIVCFFKGSLLNPMTLWTTQSSSLWQSLRLITLVFFDQAQTLFVIYTLLGFVDTICFYFSYPRFISLQYYAVFLGVFFVIGDFLEIFVGRFLILLEKCVTCI